MTEAWQDIATGFGVGFTAYAATNLDNMLLIGGLLAGGARRGSVAIGFTVAAARVILVASSFTALSYFLPPAMLGYLGIIPIALGLRLLFQRNPDIEGSTQLTTGAMSVAVILAANSLDTVAAFAPLFAESETIVRLALVVGFALAAGVLFAVVLRSAERLSTMTDKGTIAQRIAAVIMILVGIYVLLDTGTDLV